MFKRVFGNIFNEQMDTIIEQYQKLGTIPELDNEDTARKFEQAVKLVYESSFKDAV